MWKQLSCQTPMSKAQENKETEKLGFTAGTVLLQGWSKECEHLMLKLELHHLH